MNEELETRTFFVPGNHDVWREDKSSINSLNNLNASKYAVTDRVVEINDEWAVGGALPGYDYSLETEERPSEPYQASDTWTSSRCTNGQMDAADSSDPQ